MAPVPVGLVALVALESMPLVSLVWEAPLTTAAAALGWRSCDDVCIHKGVRESLSTVQAAWNFGLLNMHSAAS